MKENFMKALVVMFDSTATLFVAAALGAITGLLMQQEAGVLVGAVAALVGHTLRSVTVRLK